VKRWFPFSALLVIACSAGIFCGQLALRSIVCRDAIGVLFGHGHLLALARGHGIYEVDLKRARAEMSEAGENVQDRHEDKVEQRFVLGRMVAAATMGSLAADEKVSDSEIAHELDVAHTQFRDEKSWRIALKRSRLSLRRFRQSLAAQLRERRWLFRQIGSLSPTPADCQTFYDTHPESFRQPERFRASHLFLAAPPETPPDDVDLKQKTIATFSERLRQGEDFFELVAQVSEDEATKARGGDLGFFSESRMPPDFFAAVRAMRVGEVSPPVRTGLGFHIIQITDSKPARQMNFDEARAEIGLALENAKRNIALRDIGAQLVGRAEFVCALP
jgi:hypothetical protein